MTGIHWRNPLLTVRAPEWVFAFYALLVHFFWEMMQTPFFQEMPAMAHWPATLFCLRATVGDVAITLVAYLMVAVVERDRGWFIEPVKGAVALYLGVGLVLTAGLEVHAVYWAHRWAYSPVMPIVPGLGIGLVPVVQWIVVPMVVLFVVRRHHLGAGKAGRG